MAELSGRHVRAMRYLVVVMAVLVVGGIAIDIFTAPRTSFATAGAASGHARQEVDKPSAQLANTLTRRRRRPDVGEQEAEAGEHGPCRQLQQLAHAHLPDQRMRGALHSALRASERGRRQARPMLARAGSITMRSAASERVPS